MDDEAKRSVQVVFGLKRAGSRVVFLEDYI
jgi:hypothetical protein